MVRPKKKTFPPIAVSPVYGVPYQPERMLSRFYTSLISDPISLTCQFNTTMMTFRFLYLWLATLSSLIILVSGSAINIPRPPPPTDIINFTTTFSPADAPLLVSPSRRQEPEQSEEPEELEVPQETEEPEIPTKPKMHWDASCNRLNPGRHNCPLMQEACHMFFKQNWKPGDRQRVRYEHLCKMFICEQTMGDCFQNGCTWKCS